MALNVLVVDDSAVMRKMIIRTLQLTGVPLGEVHEAGDGAEGLAQLDRHWIDLALVDLNMPVMNGEEMIERLRANPELASVPVVVVSTDGSETRLARIRPNVNGFVRKPFTPEQLGQEITRIVGEIGRE
jgi:two-component system chemotaxis response regulator CheY